MYNLQCDVKCTRDQRLEQVHQAEADLLNLQRKYIDNHELVAMFKSFRLGLADYRRTALGY